MRLVWWENRGYKGGEIGGIFDLEAKKHIKRDSKGVFGMVFWVQMTKNTENT